MLHFVTFPMHLNNGHVVTLEAVLGRLPANRLLWRILHFTGIGKAPNGMSMPNFEHAVRASPDGYHLTWKELLAFASEVEQVWDCLIVASKPQTLIRRDTLEKNGFSDCDYVVDAFDSSEWKVGTQDEAVCARFREGAWAESANV